MTIRGQRLGSRLGKAIGITRDVRLNVREGRFCAILIAGRSQTVDSKAERCRSGRSSTLGNCSGGLRRRATDFDYRCEANHLAANASTPSIPYRQGRFVDPKRAREIIDAALGR